MLKRKLTLSVLVVGLGLAVSGCEVVCPNGNLPKDSDSVERSVMRMPGQTVEDVLKANNLSCARRATVESSMTFRLPPPPVPTNVAPAIGGLAIVAAGLGLNSNNNSGTPVPVPTAGAPGSTTGTR